MSQLYGVRALSRLRVGTITLSLASLPFIVPHVVEDFSEGIAERVGLSAGNGAFLLGGFLALQVLGLVLVGQGRQGGFLLTFWIGFIWVAGALVDHGPALLAGRFHAGATSVLWALGLILTQAACAVLSASGWLRARSMHRRRSLR